MHAAGESKQDAQVALKGTSSGDKNELLFSRFGINYNEVPQRYRKGTTLYRGRPGASVSDPRLCSDGVEGSGPGGDHVPEVEQALRIEKVATSSEGALEILSSRGSTIEESCDNRNSSGGDTQGEASAGAGAESRGVSAAGAGDGSIPNGDERSAPTDADTKQSAHVGSGSGKAPRTARATTPVRVSDASTPVDVGRRTTVPGDGIKASGKLGGQIGPSGKGQPNPGAVLEEVCDIIRDDFWNRNPHILAGVERRR